MISKILRYKLKYLLNSSKVIVEPGATLIIDSSVKILKSNIYVGKGASVKISSNTQILNSNMYIKASDSKVQIGSNCTIKNIDLALWRGNFNLGDYSILGNGNNGIKNSISVDGNCWIGEYNRIHSGIWVRFEGKLSIGNRNAINEYTDIRCDEKIEIGDYNQISYYCDIWDTNTHCIYDPQKRRRLTDEQYPGFGEEIEKPLTEPILIGNDCWLGKKVTLLKGSSIGDKSIVGYGTLIGGKNIANNSTVVSKSNLQIINNKGLIQ